MGPNTNRTKYKIPKYNHDKIQILGVPIENQCVKGGGLLYGGCILVFLRFVLFVFCPFVFCCICFCYICILVICNLFFCILLCLHFGNFTFYQVCILFRFYSFLFCSVCIKEYLYFVWIPHIRLNIETQVDNCHCLFLIFIQ